SCCSPLCHLARFRGIQGHRLFTKNMLTVLEGGERNLLVSSRRRYYADQVDIRARNHVAPIIADISDLEFLAYSLRVLSMRAGDRDYLRSDAIFECGDLSCARKARPDNANADDFLSQDGAPLFAEQGTRNCTAVCK